MVAGLTLLQSLVKSFEVTELPGKQWVPGAVSGKQVPLAIARSWWASRRAQTPSQCWQGAHLSGHAPLQHWRFSLLASGVRLYTWPLKKVAY